MVVATCRECRATYPADQIVCPNCDAVNESLIEAEFGDFSEPAAPSGFHGFMTDPLNSMWSIWVFVAVAATVRSERWATPIALGCVAIHWLCSRIYVRSRTRNKGGSEAGINLAARAEGLRQLFRSGDLDEATYRRHLESLISDCDRHMKR